jgi:dynein heavy chain
VPDIRQAHAQALLHARSAIRERWAVQTRAGIKAALTGVGKGWFNLEERSRDVYEASKLYKLLAVAQLAMSATLRELAEASAGALVRHAESAAAWHTECRTCGDVTSKHPGNDLPELSEALLTHPPFTLATSVREIAAPTPVSESAESVESADADADADKGAPDASSKAAHLPPAPAHEVFFLSAPSDFVQTIEQAFDRALDSLDDVPRPAGPALLPNMFFATKQVLSPPPVHSPFFTKARADLVRHLASAAAVLDEYLACFGPYNELLTLDEPRWERDLRRRALGADVELGPEELSELVRDLDRKAERLVKEVPNRAHVGAFLVDNSAVQEWLVSKRRRMAATARAVLAEAGRSRAAAVCSGFDEMAARLRRKPRSIEDVTETREFIGAMDKRLGELKKEIVTLVSYYDASDKLLTDLPKPDAQLRWRAEGWPRSLRSLVVETEDMLAQEAAAFQDEQASEQRAFGQQLIEIGKAIASFAQRYTSLADTDAAAEEAERTSRQLGRFAEKAKMYNRREGLMSLPLTDYSSLTKMTKEFEPLAILWRTAAAWSANRKQWLDGRLIDIDAEFCEREVGNLFRAAHKSVRAFRERAELQAMAETVKTEITQFRRLVPLVVALRQPGMRERHWERVSVVAGIPVNPEAEAEAVAERLHRDGLEQLPPEEAAEAYITLQKAVDLGLAEPAALETVQRASDVAAKEFAIEKSLDAISAEWADLSFEIVPYGTTGTFILRGSDDVVQKLDDSAVMVQAMSFSPFKKPFEDRINTWEQRLSTISEVVEGWLAVQRNWLYLEPIFASDDIQRQLPSEAKRFKTADRTWRSLMAQANRSPGVLSFALQDRLVAKFKEAEELLDRVQKGLSSYLDTKRQAFPRFFFLSPDELLSILSQTRDPTAVQPHVRRCFEAMQSLEFKGEENAIMSMTSPEGEVVKFDTPLLPKGNVEHWMSQLEKLMFKSIRTQVAECLADFVSCESRTDWILRWPAQAILAVDQVFWAVDSEKAIEEGSVPALYETLCEQLRDLTKLVRSGVSRLGSRTLSALITIDVHARDVTKTFVDLNVSSVQDFTWFSQLRYYWADHPDTAQEELVVKQVQTVMRYGYEYLGNSSRLVITPLTDRIYMTLMGALHLKMGGAPAGPAGTGKTESVKDLAKALAIQAVVFNCSDGLDYLAMAQFFKGLASCGAWACFDEFNRIEIEVLSVIAQQILTIQRAISSNAPKFLFEGMEITTNHSFGVFITMNPGYAGRTELPDNLKALFRGVSCMVPDYTLIAEIRLFSFGFSHASELANKITTTFRLSSEQLSSQDHYDYGMRAVNTVIVAAGSLRRSEPDLGEHELLLRALREVNLPKFLAIDVELFEAIISDLFPSTEPPVVDYGAIYRCMKESCAKMNLQPREEFLEKCMQLYQTTELRHGLMIVGPTGAGKTAMYQVLADALTTLAEEEAAAKVAHPAFMKVATHVLNPKAITMGQLYGQFDEATHEWSDGILAAIIRLCSNDMHPVRHWVLFDGPVDAVWIENMNTCLDDNKKLCLTSGETIKLSERMNLIFEVADLAVASPATVSRCGMVYSEPSTVVPASSLVRSWLDALPAHIRDEPEKKVAKTDADGLDTEPAATPSVATPKASSAAPARSQHYTALENLFELLLEPSVRYLRHHCSETVATTDSALYLSLLSMLDCFVAEFALNDLGDVPAERMALLPSLLPAAFVFAVVWSVGAGLDAGSRPKFDQWLRGVVTEHSLLSVWPLPPSSPDCTVFDVLLRYKFPVPKRAGEEEDLEPAPFAAEWVPWMESVPAYAIESGTEFVDMIVPTLDSVRSTYVLRRLVENGKHVLCVGETGTMKTAVVKAVLLNDLDPERYLPIFVNFSARTSANIVQDQLDGRCDKRRKGVYGPSVGKRFAIFVDDVNMPQREIYGAQPPIELLRQWMDHEGWYDRAALTFRRIVDTQFIGAMGPPGGGRNPVTQRFLRHFTMLSFPDLGHASLQRIMGTIFAHFLNEKLPPLAALAQPVVHAAIDIFQRIRDELLPTPERSHYTFNLRDLSKVFQGMLIADPKRLASKRDVAELWVHESSRVFQDRLINSADRTWFKRAVDAALIKHLSTSWAEVVGDTEPLYGDFFAPGADPRSYCASPDNLKAIVEEYLDDYNASSTAPMRLVMFRHALEHAARVARIIRQPRGHALLLGVGGSGRQSLTRLASFMSDYELMTVEISKNYSPEDWKTDLKRFLMQAGLEAKPVVFLLSDTQIVREEMLEDVNNILNSGDVPNLYDPAELDQIYTAMRPICQAANMSLTKLALFQAYLARVSANIHLVIAMSPIGATFRRRIRMFPSLVSNATLDWYSPWPEEALRSVAIDALSSGGDVELSHEQRDRVVELCVEIHASVEKASLKFKAELGRVNHVTPTSYLELLSVFKDFLRSKGAEVNSKRERLVVGLRKLEDTAEQVAKMQEELTELRPVLLATSQQVDEMMAQITTDKAEAAEQEAIVSRDEAAAQTKAAECQEIKDDAEKDLAEALPALDRAVASLKLLKVSDISEMGRYVSPPAGVKLVMGAVCVMFEQKPVKAQDPDHPGKTVEDFWEPGRKLLADPRAILDRMFTFDKDNIPERILRKIQPYIDDPEFTPENIKKKSSAATSMCMWVRAMELYARVAKDVEPKRQRLAAAETELAETNASLAKTVAALSAVQKKVAELEQQFNDAVAKKEDLAAKVKQVGGRLDRAQRLMGGLGGERGRWRDSVGDFDRQLDCLVGDVGIAAGAVCYLGAFTAEFRTALMTEWRATMDRIALPYSQRASPASVLTTEVQTREWAAFGLPSDANSVENAVFMEHSRRYSLVIDPQGQANKFVRARFREASLEVVKGSDRDLLRTLENAIRFGRPVLLENVGENLDPALEPILKQETFKQNGSLHIRLGDAVIPWHPDFKLFLTTTLPSPVYSPETAVKVTLVNMAITQPGLVQQLLGLVVSRERPDLEETKGRLVAQNAAMRKELSNIESSILQMLSEAEGNILDNEDLIAALGRSKETSAEIQAKVAVAEATEKEIDETRNLYTPVAVRAATLFFAVDGLSCVDPMYEYALQWFVGLFDQSIRDSEHSEDLNTRLENLNAHFTYNVYSTICRSLFEQHKLLFSVLLAFRIDEQDGALDPAEFRHLLTGATAEADLPIPPQSKDWLTLQNWTQVCGLTSLSPAFKQLAASFARAASAKAWRAVFDAAAPHREALPGAFSEVSPLQRILVLKCLRPDKVMEALQDHVAHRMGEAFIDPPTFDLEQSFSSSNPTMPLVFVLSTGADPMADLTRFAEQRRMSRKMFSISLGQGQGVKAERMIAEGAEKGHWVVLMNAHLSVSWMPALERCVEQLTTDAQKVHNDFRLWITSMPSSSFPVPILQNSVKMTIQPPKGLRANLLRSYAQYEDTYLDDTVPSQPAAFKKLVYALSYFHAIIQDRRKFGPLATNIPYEFTRGDLDVSLQQLALLLETYDAPPYDVIRILTGEINYGGNITDQKDRRTTMTLLEDYINPSVVESDTYEFSAGCKDFLSWPVGSQRDYIDVIRKMPLNPSPEVFGLHENADLNCNQAETDALIESLTKLSGGSSAGSGGVSRAAVLKEVVNGILARVPKPYDIEDVAAKHPTRYSDSLNTVLQQECMRYNRLVTAMHAQLPQLLRALVGEVVMSEALEEIADALFMNRVPDEWERIGFPSLKPLAPWVSDVCGRLGFLQSWIDNGKPAVFNLSCFFFPQAFLTGTLQNYARREKLPIDTIDFEYRVVDSVGPDGVPPPVDTGILVTGPFIEGATWDYQRHVLCESRPKELYTRMPVMHLKPAVGVKIPESGVYECPIYKTLRRAGTLSTTGHSTNYLMTALIPSDRPQEHWIKRGCALICALNH